MLHCPYAVRSDIVDVLKNSTTTVTKSATTSNVVDVFHPWQITRLRGFIPFLGSCLETHPWMERSKWWQEIEILPARNCSFGS